MKNTKTIELPAEIVKEAEQLAKKEGRSKTELVEEALGRYMRRREWDEINTYGRKRAKELGIKEEDVDRIIHEHRAEERAQNKVKQPAK